MIAQMPICLIIKYSFSVSCIHLNNDKHFIHFITLTIYTCIIVCITKKKKTVAIYSKKFSWSANSLLRLIYDNLSAGTNIIQQQSSTHTHHHAPLTATIRFLALACAQPYDIKLTCSFIHSYYILYPFKKG